MSELDFTKMHALGNDFVMVDATRERFTLNADTVAQMADRHTGIGFDQLLVAQASEREGVDFFFRVFNADGSEVEQCGNGARCFARFVRDSSLTNKDDISVHTRSGDVMTLQITDDTSVTVDIGEPVFDPAGIPLLADQPADTYEIDVAGQAIEVVALSVGNPHAVVCVDNVARARVEQLGPLLESHERFPERVNVGFMHIINRGEIALRVYERGVGETRACGSGACAAVVAGRVLKQLDETVIVNLPGGRLKISWLGTGHPVLMTGPASTVFKGRYTLPPA